MVFIIIYIIIILYNDKVGIPDYSNGILINNVSTYTVPSNGIITGAINSAGDDVAYKIKRNNTEYVVARARTTSVTSYTICFPFFIIVKKSDILTLTPTTSKTSDRCYFYPFL